MHILPGSKIKLGGYTFRGGGGGRVLQWCWVNFQCRGVLLIWIIVGQGPIALAEGAGGGLFGHFFSLYPFSPLSPSLWETARYRLKYCLKEQLNPKQPTNQPTLSGETTLSISFLVLFSIRVKS